MVGIQLIPDQSMDIHMWLSTADGLYDNIIHWPFTDIPVFHEMYKARTSGEMLDYTMSESVTKEFFQEYFKLEAVPKERKTATQHVKVIGLSAAYQKLTGIFLMRYTKGSYSPEEKDIIARFSKAFEQTYTRFLDLQKAEAQARESQIQSALERVRARTMAMQRSNELQEVLTCCFSRCWHWIFLHGVVGITYGIKTEKICTGWMNSKGSGRSAFKIPLTENPAFIRFDESRRKGEDFYVEQKSGAALEADYNYMLSIPVLGETNDEFLKSGLIPRFSNQSCCQFFKWQFDVHYLRTCA